MNVKRLRTKSNIDLPYFKGLLQTKRRLLLHDVQSRDFQHCFLISIQINDIFYQLLILTQMNKTDKHLKYITHETSMKLA